MEEEPYLGLEENTRLLTKSPKSWRDSSSKSFQREQYWLMKSFLWRMNQWQWRSSYSNGYGDKEQLNLVYLNLKRGVPKWFEKSRRDFINWTCLKA